MSKTPEQQLAELNAQIQAVREQQLAQQRPTLEQRRRGEFSDCLCRCGNEEMVRDDIDQWTCGECGAIHVGGNKSSDPTMKTAAVTTNTAVRTANVSSVGATRASTAQEPTKPKLADRLKRPTTSAQPSHVIIKAGAGTGKTTTLIDGVGEMRGIRSQRVPSQEQRQIWQALAESRNARTVCFTSFSNAIVGELDNRKPEGTEATGLHKMGGKAIRRSFNLLPGLNGIRADRTVNIIGELLCKDVKALWRESPVLMSVTRRLVSLCKQNLIPLDIEDDGDQAECYRLLDDLTTYYDLTMEDDYGTSYRSQIYDLVPRVMARAKDVNKDKVIDFDDMIWLPVIMNLPMFQYDLLLVDEAQDLNRAQQALTKRAGRRLIYVGDPKQAIYGFAGADCESMDRLYEELCNGTDRRGCRELSLTYTRRCGKRIVDEANRIGKDYENFHAFEENHDGLVSHAAYHEVSATGQRPHYMTRAANGDMVLCRVNAPLVSQCFRFLRMGRKATIQGRDMVDGLVNMINRFHANSVPDLVQRVGAWLHAETEKEQAKRNPSEQYLITLADKHDCVVAFTENQTTVQGVLDNIDRVFSNELNGDGVKLSSIHKAKGLEANRVFLLEPGNNTVPHPMARTPWARKQDLNLRYVALTRAIHELVYVS